MNRILTIYRQPDLDIKGGSAIRRKAFRAIIFKDDKILMIKSMKYGEMKFPGGGRETAENAYDVLQREVMEETGYKIKTRVKPYASTLEYARDFKGEYDLFIQDSRYYICKIYEEQLPTSYSDYEVEYGYFPLWTTLEEAIENNQHVDSNDLIPWRERDTEMMRILLESRRKK